MSKQGKRNVVIIDKKGEIAAVVVNDRRKVCGKENVKIINPYTVLMKKRSDEPGSLKGGK